MTLQISINCRFCLVDIVGHTWAATPRGVRTESRDSIPIRLKPGDQDIFGAGNFPESSNRQIAAGYIINSYAFPSLNFPHVIPQAISQVSRLTNIDRYFVPIEHVDPEGLRGLRLCNGMRWTGFQHGSQLIFVCTVNVEREMVIFTHP